MPISRTIAIGDIHGCHIALDNVLKSLALTSDDTVVVLGDVVDRGPGTRQAVNQLLEVEKTCRLVFIKGNHEEMMLLARFGHRIQNTWLRYGGQETLESYGGGYGMIPDHHWAFYEAGLDYWETETEIFVHANLNPEQSLDAQDRDWLRWSRMTGDEQPREDGRRVICGHSSLQSGMPWVIPGWVCIDTWCYGGKPLTALDVTNNVIHQATQAGETLPIAPLVPDP